MSRPVIIISSRRNDWILDYIALDLKKKFNGKIQRLPSSRRQLYLRIKSFFFLKEKYFIFMHQNLFLNAVRLKPNLVHAQSVVHFTHQMSYSEEAKIELSNLRFANKIVVHSHEIRNFLISIIGELNSSHIVVSAGGADLSFFSNLNTQRKTRSVILVVYFAVRKRPDLILRTVRTNPDYNFILHGRNWEDTIFLKELKQFSNFQYHEFDFARANELFNASEIFLSLSDIEGGPLPALEALAAGCRVVLTNTGFSQELRESSAAVLVIPTNPSSSVVTQALDSARVLPPPVSSQISSNFSYDKFLQTYLLE
jgi:glycosyltransferase involved in cell wall biosynthesis